MKKLVVVVASAVAMLGFALTPLVSAPVYALIDCSTATNQAGCGACAADPQATTWSDADGCKTSSAGNGNLNSIIQTVINVMLFIIGTLSVIMIIYGGIRYVTSTGDKNKVDGAKNTIIYAVVGLVVSIVAFALVQWVFNSLVK